MKPQYSLYLASFFALLSQANPAAAQQQPRFGYGSAPRGSYVIPAPPQAPRPAANVRPASVPVKAKPKVAQAPKPPVKSVKPKAVEESRRIPSKQLAASNQSKSASQKAAPRTSPKKAVAKNDSKSNRSKSSVNSSPARQSVASASRNDLTQKPKPSSREESNVETLITAHETASRRTSSPASASPPGLNPSLAKGGAGLLADVSRPADEETPASFHFFGTPITLPGLPGPPSADQPTAAGPASVDRDNFVDVLAARHSLLAKARLPEKTVAAQATTGPVMDTPEVPARDQSTPPDLSGATSAAPTLNVADLELTLEEKSTALLEEKSGVTSSVESAKATPDIVEPLVEISTIRVAEAPLAAQKEIVDVPSPVRAEPESVTEEASLETLDDDQMKLSERERAFVRSLAEAAGSVTPADGKLSPDTPSSDPIAATTLMEQIPAEAVTSLRVDAATAQAILTNAAPDEGAEPAPEISDETTPASPTEIPDRLPTFKAPTTGKIDIQSDRQADYDQENNKVIYTGKVELNSAAVRLRADRLEVFLKEGGGGMERVEASGNVVMRTRDTANAPGQMASAGRAGYSLKTGEITLSDWPKIQETSKSHISTDPSTKMYLFTDGRLRTDGPNRTILVGN